MAEKTKFDVTVEVITKQTYQVDAKNRDDAERLGRKEGKEFNRLADKIKVVMVRRV